MIAMRTDGLGDCRQYYNIEEGRLALLTVALRNIHENYSRKIRGAI
jgi:hypothetical protein